MKKLLILAILATLTGCGRSAKIGDCVAVDGHIFKVIDRGEYGYKLMDTLGAYHYTYGGLSGINFEKADCFDRFLFTKPQENN